MPTKTKGLTMAECNKYNQLNNTRAQDSEVEPMEEAVWVAQYKFLESRPNQLEVGSLVSMATWRIIKCKVFIN